MFLPGRDVQQEKEQERQTFGRIEQWALECIPENLRGEADISVQQVQCGDPNCAPIDTIITIYFNSGGQGIFGLPMEAKDVTTEELRHFFPDVETLTKWHAGQEADWPPQQEQAPLPNDQLRFVLGSMVECKVSPTDWMSGQIIQLWYREEDWPAGSFAPYKIQLEDGRFIFAPADLDAVIRLDPAKEAENTALLQAMAAAGVGPNATTANDGSAPSDTAENGAAPGSSDSGGAGQSSSSAAAPTAVE